ncbi:MAG: DUF938 domain-containing protein [Alphaproteobacteria bacterium]|nr:DUF938 domain-containing protein [Alphaproteobacteria bacterium]
MSTPTSGHTAAFRAGAFPVEEDGRIVGHMVEKNAKPVIDGLSPFLRGVKGAALEIGSGTGQHIVRFARAFPDLDWTPSEPDAFHRYSIDAWRKHEGNTTNPAIEIDAAADWAAQTAVRAIAPLSLILNLNVIHISPFSVACGIVNGAGAALREGGLLAFYGPFRENGLHTGVGNATFDARLRADNPDWGLRDVAEITALGDAVGLTRIALLNMPANNRILILQKT